MACRDLLLAIAIASAPLVRAVAAAGDAAPPRFEEDIRPILATKCVTCHGGEEPKAELDLRALDSIFDGGSSGPALDGDHPEKSLLLEKIVAGEMPPEDAIPLSADELGLIRRWIESGPVRPASKSPETSDDHPADLWSFRPLARPDVPRVRQADAVCTPIDAFILARLEAVDLGFSPPADRLTLLRRATLDLTGLPPSIDEQNEFLSDDRKAYERLVDKLLTSPRFGERFGRHWLDVVGYVDTVGFDTDSNNIITSENKWRYRDYVIAAFNQDKPYDQFLREQLAGDELVDWRHADRFSPEILESLIATGFLRNARDETHEPESNIPLSYFGVLHDTIEIVGSSLLGLTLHCARCHNHKFDPVTQADYYRLMAVFTPAYNPKAWKPVYPWKPEIADRTLPDVSSAERAQIERDNSEVEARVKARQQERAQITAPYANRLRESKAAALPEPIRSDVATALATPADKRSEVQKYLADKFQKTVEATPAEIDGLLGELDKARVAQIDQAVADLKSRLKKFGKIQALFDVGPPPETHLLRRGNHETPGSVVPAGFLRALCDSDDAAIIPDPPANGATSGRRLALGRWLTTPGTPAAGLVARVMVNRLWQHLFGEGIVPTTENLGSSGQPPTHPQLLEWLAAEFVDGGWRIKPILRQMMLSTVYRQASQRPRDGSLTANAGGSAGDKAERLDPENRLLWRMRLKRLEGEAIRDCLLAAAGNLNLDMGGPPVPIESQPDGRVVVAEKKLARPEDAWRRSIYLLFRRAYNVSLLTAFDQPLVATACPRRDTSAVALQSLFMLNDAFVADQARRLGDRVAHHAPDEARARIELAFRLALARAPTDSESAVCADLLSRNETEFRAAGAAPDDARDKSLAELCLTLFNTSEFLYAE